MRGVTIRLKVDCDEQERRIGRLVLVSILLLTTAAETARGQASRPDARAARLEPAPLSRLVPRRDLVLYLDFDGLDAHVDAWRRSAACKLLNDTKLGAVLEDLALQGIELVQESAPREKRSSGAEVVDLLKNVARQGFVVGCSGNGSGDWRVVIGLRGGDRPELKRLLEFTGFDRGREDGAATVDPAPFQKAGRTFYPLGREGVWLVENGDLILTGKKNVEEIVAVLDGKEPSVKDHLLRAELAGANDGFQRAAIGFFDMAPLSRLSSEAVRLSLDGLERIELRWGFHDDALLTKLRVVAPGPRRGALALFDAPSFGVDSLPPMPANLTGLTVLSIDLPKAYDQVVALTSAASGGSSTGPTSVGLLARLGLDVRRDILQHLGPKLAFYAQAPRGAETDSTASLLMSQIAGFTFAAHVREGAVVSQAIDALIKEINRMLSEQFRVLPRNRVTPNLASLSFQRVVGRPAYVMELPPNSLPQPFVTTFHPTVMLGQDQLVVSASTDAAARALVDGPCWQPAGAFVPVVKRLPAGMVYLSLSDPRASTTLFTKILPVLVRQMNAEIALAQRRVGRASTEVFLRVDPDMIPPADELNRLLFPSSTTLVVDPRGAVLAHREAIPTLTSPAVAGVLVALLVRAIESHRDAARRAQCVNNFRQIARAMHNYNSTNNAFPRPAILDEKGKPLLSWRVAILPYIGQQGLYSRFRLDEPWDGPHNKGLLKEMPPLYLCPSRAKVEPFATTYRVFVGNGVLFESDKDIGVADVTDGTSNTIMVVEAKEAVPWTKPDDLSFDPAKAPSLGGAGSPHPGGFNAATADGAVRFIKSTIDLNVFRALITRAAGEVVGAGAF